MGRPAAGDARRATWALTDRALLRVEEAGLIIVALAAGCSARDVQADANGTLLVSADVDEMVSS